MSHEVITWASSDQFTLTDAEEDDRVCIMRPEGLSTLEVRHGTETTHIKPGEKCVFVAVEDRGGFVFAPAVEIQVSTERVFSSQASKNLSGQLSNDIAGPQHMTAIPVTNFSSSFITNK